MVSNCVFLNSTGTKASVPECQVDKLRQTSEVKAKTAEEEEAERQKLEQERLEKEKERELAEKLEAMKAKALTKKAMFHVPRIKEKPPPPSFMEAIKKISNFAVREQVTKDFSNLLAEEAEKEKQKLEQGEKQRKKTTIASRSSSVHPASPKKSK